MFLNLLLVAILFVNILHIEDKNATFYDNRFKIKMRKERRPYYIKLTENSS